jgi:indolepyruvate ferredoxin oxidoreductase alpha subunit
MAQSMRGDRALAVGALAAGVTVVSGYPGSPATSVFDAFLSMAPPQGTHIQWAPNEKVALELAYGASLGGARALVVLKSVGLNIALDPLATMVLSGCHAGLVILLGDDPGGWGSQNEQDSRWLARVAEVPVVEPTGVEQAAALMTQAYAWSESLGTPVIVRVTGALTLAQGAVAEPWHLPPMAKRFILSRDRWVVLPANVVARRRTQHRRLRQIQAQLESSPYDTSEGDASLGIIAVGVVAAKLRALLDHASGGAAMRVLSLSSVYPLPERALERWLRGMERVLVLEEGSPFVEESLRDLAQRCNLALPILGRSDRAVAEEGELDEPQVAQALQRLDSSFEYTPAEPSQRAMPSRVPLCDDCPYRPTFEALLRAMERHGGRQRHIIVGETGCMVRANLPPMELFDVKYSLGSGLGVGLGLAATTAMRGDDQHVVALLGDSSFFHSDINAMPYAAQVGLPLLVLVLDNGTTALTGGQAHPGSTIDERGNRRPAADLVSVIRGCGVQPELHTPGDVPALEAALDRALTDRTFHVLVVRGPCTKYAG